MILPRAFWSKVTVGFGARGSRLLTDGLPKVLNPVTGALCDVFSRTSHSDPVVQPF